MKISTISETQRIDAYIRIMDWTTKRYTINGELITHAGHGPMPYVKIERLAWDKYMRSFLGD